MKAKHFGILAVFCAALLLSVFTYHWAHLKNAGKLVYPTCNGGYVLSRPGPDGGGPCLSGSPYVLRNDYTDFNASLVLLALVVIGGGVIISHDLGIRQERSKSTRTNRRK